MVARLLDAAVTYSGDSVTLAIATPELLELGGRMLDYRGHRDIRLPFGGLGFH